MKNSIPTVLMPGHMLKNRYIIKNTIGQGGFGVTYLAYDKSSREYVAAKELFPSAIVSRNSDGVSLNISQNVKAEFDHYMKRFEDEAKILISLNQNPDILQVKHFFTENNTAYIVMEYLSGTDFRRYFKKHGVLKWSELSVYIKAILRSLDILHGKGLIHRDISPDNIFLTNKGRVVLIDYGSVRGYTYSRKMTTILKNGYAPYEQYREIASFGPWTDIYALSVTIYYLLSGVMPPMALERALKDELVPLGRLCHDLPESVLAAVGKGMAVMPEKRIRSISQYREIMFGSEAKGIRLQCTAGTLKGSIWQVYKDRPLRAGRLGGSEIKYADNAPGISRRQCVFSLANDGSLCIRDENSTYGTYVNGIRLKGGIWYRIKNGNTVCFGNEVIKVIY